MLSRLVRPTIALAAALSLVAFAQTASSEEISPESKMDGGLRSVFALSSAQTSGAGDGGVGLLADTIALYEDGSLVEGVAARSLSAGSGLEIGLLVKTSGGADEIEATGVSVGSQVGGIVTARATLDEVWRIAGLESVSALEASVIAEPDEIIAPRARAGEREPALDETPEFLGADAWHQGGFTGQGVVVGIIDSGVWPDHPSFQDDGGDSIFYAGWDQGGTAGPPPPGFAIGTHFTQQQFVNGTADITDTTGHGTGLAGVAFGQPFDGTTGIAPGATPVIVKTDFATANILDAIQFALNQAGLLGQPLVVNLSLGTHFGAHDGTSLFEQGLGTFVDQGVGIVGSAGNDGNSDIHTWFDVTPGSTVAPTIGMPQGQGPSDNLFTFYFDGSEVCVGVETPNGFGTTTPVCPNGGTGVDTPDGCFFIDAFVNPSTGNTQVVFDAFGNQFGCQDPVLGGDWTLIFDGSSVDLTTKVDGWSASGTPFSNGWGDNRSTVHIPATSPDVLAVGGWVNNPTYEAADGQTYGFDPFSEFGTLGGFSSRGPNANGDLKPDVTAPGVNVRAPYSPDANLPLANQYPGGLFQAIAGTSMSSPHIAGVMALMKSAYPDRTMEEIKSALMNTAVTDTFTGETPNNDWGAGKVDLTSVPYNDDFDGSAVVSTTPFNALWDVSITTTQDGEPTGPCTGSAFHTTWQQMDLPSGTYMTTNRWGDYSGFTNVWEGDVFQELDFQACTNGTGGTGPNIYLPLIISGGGTTYVQSGSSSPFGGTQGIASAGGSTLFEFSIAPAQESTFGDLDCDGDSDSVDALKALQNVAGIPVNQPAGCPDLGEEAFAVGDETAADGPWGDLDCDGDSDSVDALKALQALAGISVNQPADCPDLGEDVLVPA